MFGISVKAPFEGGRYFTCVFFYNRSCSPCVSPVLTLGSSWAGGFGAVCNERWADVPCFPGRSRFRITASDGHLRWLMMRTGDSDGLVPGSSALHQSDGLATPWPANRTTPRTQRQPNLTNHSPTISQKGGASSFCCLFSHSRPRLLISNRVSHF